MRNALLLILLFCSFKTLATDTLHITSHKEVVVVTNPTDGFKPYRQWVVFPTAGTPVRKINLNVTFGCPDSLRCADWDYLDHIFIRRKGGVNAPALNYEIGRMLTPYGGAFGKTWQFTWQTEITDFSLLLRDSVEIEYYHSGFEPNNDRGWKITVDFEIIKGKPVLEPLAIHSVYSGSYPYGDSANYIENRLQPFSFTSNKNARLARVFIYQTGHGMDANGCGEFCSRYRETWFNGRMIDKRDIWKKCGDNPLFPQAGTWVIDRAYWCPGELQLADRFDQTIKGGQKNTFDINMQPYQVAKPSANEMITAYVIEYGNPVSKNDAAVADIIVPTDKQVHGRKNPSALHPSIIIKNNGADRLKKVDINYGTQGFPQKRYTWTGDLAFNQEALVVLPGPIQAKVGYNTFVVSLASPNGNRDAYDEDNSIQAGFTKAPVHGQNLVLHLRTNQQPEHNAYTVRDHSGKIWYERKHGSLQPGRDYRDTLRLPPGAYELLVEDTAGDGLEFWFNNKGGRGICRLLDEKGRMLQHFESDFGNFIRYGFEVSEDSSIFSHPSVQPAVGLFPTRTRGKTSLDYFSNTPQKVVVKIVTDPGDTVVEEHIYHGLKESVLDFDLSYRPPQRYYVKVYINGQLAFNKRLRVEQMRN